MGTAARDPGTGTGEHQGHSASPRPGSGGLPGENGAERADEEGRAGALLPVTPPWPEQPHTALGEPPLPR